MKLELFNADGEVIQDPSDDTIKEALRQLPGTENPFAVLTKSDEDDSNFIQLSTNEDGTTCVVEVHETATGEEELAGIKKHYIDEDYVSFDEIGKHSSSNEVPLELAIELLLMYSNGDDLWREKADWVFDPEFTSSYFLSEIIRENPDSYLAHFNRGLAYCREGWFEKAVEDFGEAVRLEPEDLDALYNRGLAHSENPDSSLEQAIKDFSEVIRLQPEMSDAWLARGRCHLDNMSDDEAIRDLTEVIRLEPENADAWNLRGSCFAAKGANKSKKGEMRDLARILEKEDFVEALKNYEQAIRLDPEIEFQTPWVETEARILFNKARENVSKAGG